MSLVPSPLKIFTSYEEKFVTETRKSNDMKLFSKNSTKRHRYYSEILTWLRDRKRKPTNYVMQFILYTLDTSSSPVLIIHKVEINILGGI